MSNPRIDVEIGANTSQLTRRLRETDRNLSDTGRSFGKLNALAVSALSGIAAAFSIGAVISFGKAVLDTTAKFQKFEAILSNTLGSESEAQLALAQITKFASVTPFAVDELTGAFVKLANQGFKPTIGELRQLGDLASSTGKSFDQLAEAVIDAQVGEFERLKEFGIRAKKSGDNVIFTFKGVETQVKNTAEALQGYVVGLGNAEGVSGSMAKISATLGGKMSNLGDNIDGVKLAIGSQTSGVFSVTLDWLNNFTSLATSAIKGVKNLKKEVESIQLGDEIQETKNEIDGLIQTLLKKIPGLTNQEAIKRAVDGTAASFRELAGSSSKGSIALLDTIDAIEAYGVQLLITANKAVPLTTEQTKLNDELAETAANLARIQKLRANAPKAVSTTNIAQTDFNAAFSPKKIDGTGTGLDFAAQFNLANANLAKVVAGAPGISLKPIEQGEFTKGLQRVQEDFQSFGGDFANAVSVFSSNINLLVRDNLASAFTDFGLSIGEALAKGENVINAIGQSLLSSMAKFIGDFGQQLIAVGVAGLAFATLIETIKEGGPAAIPASIGAIAAGVALTILAGALRSSVGKGVGGGGSGSSGVGAGGSGGSFTGSGSNSFDPFRSFEIKVVGEITGEAIGFALARGQNRKN